MKKQDKSPFPSSGDGFVTNSGRRGKVIRRFTRGEHANVDNDPTTSPDDLMYIDGEYYNTGLRINLYPGQFRQETFLEHLTRPTGFGRMHWLAFALVQAVFICAFLGDPSSWWMVLIAFLVVNGVLTLGSYMNYVRRWV